MHRYARMLFADEAAQHLRSARAIELAEIVKIMGKIHRYEKSLTRLRNH